MTDLTPAMRSRTMACIARWTHIFVLRAAGVPRRKTIVRGDTATDGMLIAGVVRTLIPILCCLPRITPFPLRSITRVEHARHFSNVNFYFLSFYSDMKPMLTVIVHAKIMRSVKATVTPDRTIYWSYNWLRFGERATDRSFLLVVGHRTIRRTRGRAINNDWRR